MDFIPTAILGDTIGPLMMSGKNKIRGAQVARWEKVSQWRPRTTVARCRTLCGGSFSLADVLPSPGLAAIGRLHDGAAVAHDP
jgi:hypothetical protein